MEKLKVICNGGCAAFALIAAACWARSATAEKRAFGDAGIGPGWDGYLVVKNADGKPIEFVASYQAQAWWDRAAAISAAIAAAFQAGSVLL